MSQIIVLSEGNLELTQAVLIDAIELNPETEIRLWIIGEAVLEPEQSMMLIHLNLIRQLYTQQFYSKHQRCLISIEIRSKEMLSHEILQLKQDDIATFIPVPIDVTRDGETYDISLSETQLTALEATQEKGISFDESLLEHSLSLPSSNCIILTPMQMYAEIYDALQKMQSQDKEWVNTFDSQYNALLDMQLWRWKLPEKMLQLMTHIHAKTIESKSRNHWSLLSLLFKHVLWDASEHPTVSGWELYYQKQKAKVQNPRQLLPAPKTHKVTFLVMTYNRLKTLKRTLKSILKQTSPHWDAIIVDGGSSDETPAYCQEFIQKHEQFRYIHKQLPKGIEGIRATLKIMIDEAPHDLLVFCPDDDWFEPEYLEKMLKTMQANPGTAMVYSSYRLRDIHSEKTTHNYGPFQAHSGLIDPRQELQRASIVGLCPQGCLYRKEVVLEEAHPLIFHSTERPTFIGWDYIIAMRLFAAYQVAHVPDYLFNISMDDNSAINGSMDSSSGLLYALEEIMRGYTAFFEQAYPDSLYTLFHDRIIKHHVINHFTRGLDSKSKSEFERFLSEKEPIWKQYVDMETLRKSSCSPWSKALFQI